MLERSSKLFELNDFAWETIAREGSEKNELIWPAGIRTHGLLVTANLSTKSSPLLCYMS